MTHAETEDPKRSKRFADALAHTEVNVAVDAAGLTVHRSAGNLTLTRRFVLHAAAWASRFCIPLTDTLARCSDSLSPLRSVKWS